MYYTEAKGHRWAFVPVAYKSLDDAKREAKRTSHECSHVLVWDCTDSPVGALVAKFVLGAEVSP